MGVGAGLYMYVVVVQKFTFAISSSDEFLFCIGRHTPASRGGSLRDSARLSCFNYRVETIGRGFLS